MPGLKFDLSFIFTLSIFLATGCAGKQSKETNKTDVSQAASVITSENLMDTIRTLSSDEYEGRSPGTPGEERTVAYVTKEFERLGLKPGNPAGGFEQKVPLVAATAEYNAEFTTKGRRQQLTPGKDIVAFTNRLVPKVDLKNSPIIFVGYGVDAPEYGWDDYKGVNVRGKTILHDGSPERNSSECVRNRKQTGNRT